ncbi:MAG: hypothetical protein GY868_15995 [Deltaproteobacteria bacterium]|nr:hypothetical protein [Deltaproteobacteria bacterium]
MTEVLQPGEGLNYVRIDSTRCNGCVLCTKVCPTRAIRVPACGSAVIEGECINCGECLRVCPQGAVSAITSASASIEMSRTALSISPVLFAQFGPEVFPDEVIAACKSMGFYAVHDLRHLQELFNVAAELYVKENCGKAGTPRPLISPVCPVTVRLIAYRFPALLKNILPLVLPWEQVARDIKQDTARGTGQAVSDIEVYHVTPCAAKMTSIKKPLLVGQSSVDGIIGFDKIYSEILKHLPKAGRENPAAESVGCAGICWGLSGGEIAGMAGGDFLAVSGIQQTIRYLEKIEMGLLDDIDYVEFRACAEGCIGGPLTVCDTYQAKHTIQQFVRRFGMERTVIYEDAERLYRQGWFYSGRQAGPSLCASNGLPFKEAIARAKRVENIYQSLPHKECGTCGSPDCRTFAEDVVDGRAKLQRCVFREKDAEGDSC